jgi:hypothetical protein
MQALTQTHAARRMRLQRQDRFAGVIHLFPFCPFFVSR